MILIQVNLRKESDGTTKAEATVGRAPRGVPLSDQEKILLYRLLEAIGETLETSLPESEREIKAELEHWASMVYPAVVDQIDKLCVS